MSDVATKWGKAVAERGFAQVPNHLLLINQFLDKEVRLGPAELLVLIQLSGAWWKKDENPFPAMRTLAIRCGVSERQIHRAIAQLEKLGLVKKINRRAKGIIASNAYDLEPLAEILREIAKQYPTDFARKVQLKPKTEIDNLTVPSALEEQ